MNRFNDTKGRHTAMPDESPQVRAAICADFEIRPDESISAWTAEAAQIYGYPASDMIGKPLSLVFPQGPFLERQNLIAAALAGQSVSQEEVLHKHREGGYLRVLLSIQPKNGAAPDEGLVLTVEVPDESSGRLNRDQGGALWSWAVVESAVEGIITIDQEGIICYANPSSQRLFGYRSEEMVGKNVSMLMPAPFHKEHDRYLANYLRTGVKKILGIGREVLGAKKDGTIFPIRLSVSEVRVGGDRIFTGTIQDITEQRSVQAERGRLLRELNRRNKELNCLYRVGQVLRGGEIGSSTLRAVIDILHPALTHSAITGARITFDTKRFSSQPFQETPWRIHAPIVVEGRQRGALEVYYLEDQVDGDSGASLDDERHLVAEVAQILREMVERKEAEAKVIQASKLASIGELAAGVGHEINNPVNSIINCADILERSAAEESRAREFAGMIRAEADRIAGIVNSLLTFSRQDKRHYSSARLCDIVESVLSLSRKKLGRSHIILRVEVPDTLPRLQCRSEQLQQVVMNLVINAMHALDEKYPGENPDKVMSIVARETTTDGQPVLRLTIEDHGIGIAPPNIERIYDPFFSTKGRDKGTGLGLSVSIGIVRDHGGTMAVESEVGKFTRFHVDLPRGGIDSQESGPGPAFRRDLKG